MSTPSRAVFKQVYDYPVFGLAQPCLLNRVLRLPVLTSAHETEAQQPVRRTKRCPVSPKPQQLMTQYSETESIGQGTIQNRTDFGTK